MTGARGRTPRRRWASPAGTPSVASRASTGRAAATRRWRGTRRATPTCPARCSTAASPCRPIRTCRARSTSFARPGSAGASWNFPARPVAELNDTAAAGTALLDKQLLTVDATKGSPFQDRIYVTWTLFAADGTSYIYEAYSRDYGEHFSAPKLVSTDSALCTNDARRPDAAGALQHEPVLAAVHRARRRAVRRVGQLQPHRRAARRGRRRGRRRFRALQRRTRRASTTAARCCWPSRPTAATRSRRR